MTQPKQNKLMRFLRKWFIVEKSTPLDYVKLPLAGRAKISFWRKPNRYAERAIMEVAI